MRSLFRKMHKGEKGFTLVELLVVFTLLAVLAAIVVPSVVNLVDYGETQARAAEEAIIQTAVDCMMAVDDLGPGDCPAVSSWTNDMSAFPDSAHALYPKYLRDATTRYYYEVTDNGTVSSDQDGT